MCPYAIEDMSLFLHRYVLMLKTYVLMVLDICAHGMKHMSIDLEPCVLMLFDTCPHGIEHMSWYVLACVLML